MTRSAPLPARHDAGAGPVVFHAVAGQLVHDDRAAGVFDVEGHELGFVGVGVFLLGAGLLVVIRR